MTNSVTNSEGRTNQNHNSISSREWIDLPFSEKKSHKWNFSVAIQEKLIYIYIYIYICMYVCVCVCVCGILYNQETSEGFYVFYYSLYLL
jgi:hypothetical protein